MPRASETVLEAGLSYREGWENRLTAILAAVLDQHAGFASALFERVGLPTGDVYEAYTEEWVTPDRRVDMQVLAKDTRGAVVAQIWSEHKRIGGGFGTNQREDYLAALEREAGEGRLLTGVADSISENAEADDEPVETANDKTDADGIAIGAEDELPSRPGEPSPEEPRWWGMTWQLLAEIAEGAGQAHPEPWGGPGWADTAVRGEAPAAQRALYELLWYLEQEGYAVVAPVAAEHVQALKHAADTFDVSLALVSRAADRMSPLVPDARPKWTRICTDIGETSLSKDSGLSVLTRPSSFSSGTTTAGPTALKGSLRSQSGSALILSGTDRSARTRTGSIESAPLASASRNMTNGSAATQRFPSARWLRRAAGQLPSSPITSPHGPAASSSDWSPRSSTLARSNLPPSPNEAGAARPPLESTRTKPTTASS